MALFVRHLSEGVKGRSRIVLLHGFTQNSMCWGTFASLLAEVTGCEVVGIDAPGHGESPSEHEDADLWESADLIAEAGGRAHYVGYSMGARMALHLAIRHPELVQTLNLIGVSPGIEDDTERRQRQLADNELADRLETLGLAAFLDEWLALPLFETLHPADAQRNERLTNRVAGLAASLRRCGAGQQENLWPRLHEITVPVQTIVGEHDAKFDAIAARISTLIDSYHATISAAGHSAHLEHPGATVDAVAASILRGSSCG